IPADALAVSVNATVVGPTAQGFVSLWPSDKAWPGVSTLNFAAGIRALANAAVVPLSSCTSPCGDLDSLYLGTATSSDTLDLVLDVNGYYSPLGVVNSVNTLTGDLTLAAGTNVSVTPTGNTLTIAATGGPGGSLPAGAANQTLYNNGSAWTASSALLHDGTNVGLTGVLNMPDPMLIQVLSGGYAPLLFAGSSSANTFLGFDAGLGNTTGTFNTFLGNDAGATSATTCCSVAIGNSALTSKTAGDYDVAVGNGAMAVGAGVPSGGYNVAVGRRAYGNGPSGSFNTAVGAAALINLTSGDHNAALGHVALSNLTSGSYNTALGDGAGNGLTSGDGNLYLASGGAATESFVTRIGGTQTQQAFIAGVRGVTTSAADAIPVLIDSNGQLGTVSSSASVKDDIRDMAGESAKLMQLRPVTFRYKAHGPDGAKQYGLIAEEVNEVLPELVARNKDGKIETVMYHELPAMLLNELQKALKRIESLESEVASLKKDRMDSR
ncbi:MAG TPA: tail fiber domain-containing protein, partial [Thermoanaerobaculia bacterium]|nr:tail fiber domain-containing protein [Thermoanaerobaculia bacterium]